MSIEDTFHFDCNRRSDFIDEKVEQFDDYSFIDARVPLNVLSFNAGTLYADFPDCNLHIGIYGTIFKPMELLDNLTIKGGVNVKKVRLAGQFLWSQEIVDRMVSIGRKFHISSNLTITINEPLTP